MTSVKRWVGEKPRHCDLCARALTRGWVDGKTIRGPWANMCHGCHKRYGVGLGLGRGQQYDRDGVKVDG